MVFGFGFNKAKVLAAAERYVQQGKLQAAINEYEKVSKEDPKDLTVLNTIGDLSARIGQTERAVEYFRRVGDAYCAEGFTVKAIAMYKKLTKLSPSAVDCVQKLAELYTQQGLYNDARAQYVILTDHFLRKGENDGAAKILRKALELDPDNANMQGRLADLYLRIGQKKEAKDIYLASAQALYAKMAVDEADRALQRALSLEPENEEALLLRSQIAVDNGDGASAIRYLNSMLRLDSRPDALRILVRGLLSTGDMTLAEQVGEKLLTVHNDLAGMGYCAEAMLAAGHYEQALTIYNRHAERFLGSDAPGMVASLKSSISKVKENARSLELLQSLFDKSGETSHATEIMELLAHALVQNGDLPRARDLYRELSQLEPQNPLHVRNYRQVIDRLGEDPATRQLSAEEGAQAFMVETLEQNIQPLEQEFPEEVSAAVRAALTEAELFSSYNMPGKAIARLEQVQMRAPQHAELNQRLAALYARAERFLDAARCCATLAEVYEAAGLTSEAEQYASLGQKYERRDAHGGNIAVTAAAGVNDATAMRDLEAAFAAFGAEATPPPSSLGASFSPATAMPEISAQAAAFAPSASEFSVEAAPVTEQAFKSAPAAGGWEEMVDVEQSSAAAPAGFNLADVAEEIRFYLSQAMLEEAEFAINKAEAAAPGNATLAQLRRQLSEARQSASAPAAQVVVEIDDAPAPAILVDPPVADEPAAPAAATLSEMMNLDEAVGGDFPTAPPPAARGKHGKQNVGPAPESAPSEGTAMLNELFDEFKEDVDRDAAADSGDPENHYSLGIAFKEMGLLDEAIGELQKVCQALDRGQKFSQPIQAYTWLAMCLVDKGVPQAAIRWYKQALAHPAVDPESRPAIYYDMACAYELAGNKTAALESFHEVYSFNIDFRDVGERIKALKP